MFGLPAELDIEFQPQGGVSNPVTFDQLPTSVRAYFGPTITLQPNAPVGSGGSLTVTASGVGPLSYQWMLNGVAVLGGTSSQLPTQGLQSGTYTVVVSNLFTSVVSNGFNYSTQNLDWTYQGLVAYYPFDGDTLDRGPLKNNLINTGATLSADRFGNPNKCYQFNGTTNWMVSESNLPVSGSQARTFLLWLKVPLDTNPVPMGQPSIIEHGLKADTGKLFSLLLSSGQPKSIFIHGSWLTHGMTGSIPTGEWFHAAVSTDGTCQGTKFYINGEAVADFGEDSGFYQTVETKLRLSTYSDSGGITNSDWIWWESGFKGWMDEVRVYQRELSGEEVKKIYWSEENPVDLVLVAGGTLPASSPLGAVLVDTFYIGKTEVTWGEWRTVRAWAVTNGYPDLANVGTGIGDNYPVTHVNWYDVVKWCNARSEKEGKAPVYKNGSSVYRTGNISEPATVASANGYRLPTEKEWEFAARGGKQTRGYIYSGSNSLDDVGWYNGNSFGSVHQVANKRANELSIFDMSGNVLEWTSDWSPGHVGLYRLHRGGGAAGPWYTYAHDGEVARRGHAPPDESVDPINILGFRVATSGEYAIGITAQPSVSLDGTTLRVAAAGAGTLTYQWRLNGAAIAGGTSSQLSTQALQSGAYTVVVSNGFASLTSGSIAYVALAITAQPYVALNGTSLNVQAEGAGTLTYQWKRNGAEVAGGTSSQLSTQGLQSGTYAVVVSNGFASVTSGGLHFNGSTPTTVPTGFALVSGGTLPVYSKTKFLASLNADASGTDSADFGDALAVGENYILVHKRTGNGSVTVFDKTTGAFLGNIQAPHKVYDTPSFGQSMGETGKHIFIGAPHTYRYGAHDGTGYFFRTEANGTFTKIHEWAENPSQWAAYFGCTGGLYGDLLISAQGSNTGWDSKGMLFFYAFNPALGTKSLVKSFVEKVTGIAPHQVAVSDGTVAVSYGLSTPRAGEVRVFNVTRDYSGKVSNAILAQTIQTTECPNAVAIGGRYVAIGLMNQSVTASGVELPNCGQVQIYEYEAGSFTLSRTLTVPTPVSNAHFGCALTIQGAQLFVGARGVSSTPEHSAGAVYVYDLGALGVPAEMLRAARTASNSGELFGSSLAAGGGRLVVGASGAFDQSASGSVYLFELGAMGADSATTGTSGTGKGFAEVHVDTFYIGKTEVTWGEWQTVRAWAVANGYTDLDDVGQGVGDNYPVSHVNWYDVVKWCNARSEKEGKTPVYTVNGAVYKIGQVTPTEVSSANGYRLPSEKEWEFAARGGTQTQGHTYSGSNNLDEVGWFYDNSGGAVHEVGKKLANELGIHDMSGNLWEWSGSWYPGYEGSYRVFRGGDWNGAAVHCSVADRYDRNPEIRGNYYGFRVALSSVP